MHQVLEKMDRNRAMIQTTNTWLQQLASESAAAKADVAKILSILEGGTGNGGVSQTQTRFAVPQGWSSFFS